MNDVGRRDGGRDGGRSGWGRFSRELREDGRRKDGKRVGEWKMAGLSFEERWVKSTWRSPRQRKGNGRKKKKSLTCPYNAKGRRLKMY